MTSSYRNIEHPTSNRRKPCPNCCKNSSIREASGCAVDREAGVIRGVKLLGLASRNGRRYREQALAEAVGLYEGAKVNINHPKGHPLSPRDYQDRLGVVRGVQFRARRRAVRRLALQPQHALSEQLVWDAEHAPQNVGMSHNVLARTTRDGDETVVEAITKVQSIDLVADPATTSGLYEQAEGRESRVEGQEPELGTRVAWLDSTLDALTLEQLASCIGPTWFAKWSSRRESQLQELRNANSMKRCSARRRRGGASGCCELLQEHDLPLPTNDGVADSQLVSGSSSKL